MSDSIGYKFRAIRVFTRKFDTAVEFYKERLGMTPDTVNEEEGFAVFPVGQALLLLESIDSQDREAKDLVGRFVGASLAVDDIADVHDRLMERGVQFESPPVKQSWGGLMAHFHDLDGNILTLVQS